MEPLPWFGEDKQLISKATYAFRHSPSIKTATDTVNLNIDDHLISLAFALSPSPLWNGSFSATAAYDKTNALYFDRMELMVQRQWLDDIIGDPVSLVTNAILTVPSRESLHNITAMHYGELEGRLSVTIGKEITTGKTWSSRYWASLCYGIANKGSPWINSYIAAEKRFNDKNRIRIFGKGNYGFSSHELTTTSDFPGYASIKHQFINCGVRYTHRFPLVGDLYIQYAYRPYAKYTPRQTQTVTISFLYPINIMPSFDVN